MPCLCLLRGLCACACAQLLSHIQLFLTPETVACQAPLSMRFPREEYWSRLPFPSLEDLPTPGIEPGFSALQADSLLLNHLGSPKGFAAAAAAANSLQSCLTLCDPIDGSPPSSPVSGILQAKTLEWVAISFSNAWKWKVKSKREVAQSDSYRPHGLQPTRLLRPWDFPGKNTGLGCHCLLQRDLQRYAYILTSFKIYHLSTYLPTCIYLIIIYLNILIEGARTHVGPALLVDQLIKTLPWEGKQQQVLQKFFKTS